MSQIFRKFLKPSNYLFTSASAKSKQSQLTLKFSTSQSRNRSALMSDHKFDIIGNNECIVLTSSDCKSRDKIAAYDLDNTLIRTVSGGPFPNDIFDWQLNLDEVVGKLRNLHGGGFKIVVFTNQAFIQLKTFSVEEIREKFLAIQRKINIPMQFFAAGAFNVYRKPRIAMWQLLQDSYNDNIPIDPNLSIFIGDAAGRINAATKRRTDHSCADRLFALNLGLKFYTPEHHFLGVQAEEPYRLPGFDPMVKIDSLSLLEPKEAELKLDEPEMVVMVGYPASGKSFFVDKHFKDFGSCPSRSYLQIKSTLINNKSCVVDDRNPDAKSRADLIKIARQLKVKVRCFHMTTSYDQSRHNMEFRELLINSCRQCSHHEFQVYENYYNEPSLHEGFDEIVRVNFVGDFGSDCDAKKLYECYLLEK